MVRKNPQDYFFDTDFVVERTLYAAPPLSMAPSVYQDVTHHKWAVHMPLSKPRVFSYRDVSACEVAEKDTPPVSTPQNVKEWSHFMLNPMSSAKRVTSDDKSTCFSMGVVVSLRHTHNAILQLPFLMTPICKDSHAYLRIRSEAEYLHNEFLKMMSEGDSK
jgi:hypothetical protein